MSSQASSSKNDKLDRKTKVLRAARKLFYKKGYRATTIDRVATQAGYSKRTVYLDFQNKDELFITVCGEGLKLLLKELKKIPLDGITMEESIIRFLDVYIQFSQKHPELFRMIFSEATPESIANCSDELRMEIANLEKACLGTVVRWAEKAIREKQIPPVDPWEVAGMTVGSATGIILLSMGGSQTVFTQKDLESLVKQTIWMIWTGLHMTKTRTGQ